MFSDVRLMCGIFSPFVTGVLQCIYTFLNVVGVGDHADNDANALLDDTVFIQGLPESVTEELLAKHFASVGSIKVRPSYLSTYFSK